MYWAIREEKLLTLNQGHFLLERKKISVVIATYNRGSKLKDAIKSIENSNYPRNKIEIIIIDDCSTDKTSNLILKLSKKNSNIKYYKTKTNALVEIRGR